MKNYELLYILPTNTITKDVKKNFLEIENNIEKLGCKMLETLLNHPFLSKTETSKEEESEELRNLPIIKRKLAYPIGKNRFGFYCLVNFSCKPENIKKVDNFLKMNKSVLRYIILQSDPMTKEELKNLEKLFARKRAEQEKERKEKQQKEKDDKKLLKPESSKTEELKKESEEKCAKIENKTAKDKKTLSNANSEVKKSKKEEKSAGKIRKRKKIKLEELEDKLDEILEDTMI